MLLLAAAGGTPGAACAQTRLGVLVSQTEGRADIERAVVAALRGRAPDSRWEATDAVRAAWSFVAPSPGAVVTDPLAQELRARLRLTTLFVIETRSQGSGSVALAVHGHDSRPAPISEFASVPLSQAPTRAAQLAEHVWSRLSRATGSARAASPASDTASPAPSTASPATGTAGTAAPARPGLGFSLGSGSALTATQLRRPLGSARRSLMSCGANISATYGLQVSLRVGADGRVQSTSTRVLEGALVISVTECVRRAAGALRFPSASGPSEVRLRLTFPGRAASPPPPAPAAASAAPAAPTVPARITIVNEQSRTRWFFVDGRHVATLRAGQRHSVEVAPGTHRVVSSESADPGDHPLSRTMSLQPGGHSQWRLSGSTGPQMQRHEPVLYPDD